MPRGCWKCAVSKSKGTITMLISTKDRMVADLKCGAIKTRNRRQSVRGRALMGRKALQTLLHILFWKIWAFFYRWTNGSTGGWVLEDWYLQGWELKKPTSSVTAAGTTDKYCRLWHCALSRRVLRALTVVLEAERMMFTQLWQCPLFTSRSDE